MSTILFFYEKKVQNYAFIGLCLLITSPLPFVGLFPFLVCSGVYQLIKTEKGNRVKFFLHNMLSPQNVIVSLTVFPLVALYYICQNAVTNTTPSTFDINIYFVYTLILFYLLEFGLYVIAIFKDNKKSIYLWIIIVMLFICPFIKIGSSIDFCMRASIPSLVLLMLLVFKTFLKTSEEKKWVSYLIIVIFAFGTLTPTMEFLRAIKTVKHEKTILLECNPIGKTLEGDSRPNFMGDKYEETFFYKYLCKKNLK
ncbi:MAG: hypothetical protein J6T84_01170 [Spirochaetaceae bacterium]|nr:hypothetical protein [Spirochaetaceae bacterium]